MTETNEAPISQNEALNAGIFAINTMLAPDASSQEDVEWLDRIGERATATLHNLREWLRQYEADREDATTFLVHRQASETIKRMHLQAAAVKEVWKGESRKFADQATDSLCRQLATLLDLFFGAQQGVYRDGDLSLVVTTPSITYGLIFHPSARPDAPTEADRRLSTQAPLMGRYCIGRQVYHLASDEGSTPHPWAPVVRGKRTCDCTNDDDVWAIPVPGEWSFHS